MDFKETNFIFMKKTGIIEADGFVRTGSGDEYLLPIRGTDDDGYPEVLMDAKSVGGRGTFQRQSILPYIGMKVEFDTHNKFGFNFKIVK